ncbi:MAG TPA: M13 family metallopeptidase [Vicinamibacterales bacterium]|nr:M13 family metallopeptidase [Vicinamibacterales bacterium]
MIHHLRAATAILSAAAVLGAQAPSQRTGLDPAAFDEAVRSEDDLFLHANGRWITTFEMPAENTNYGVFVELAERAEHDVRKIIEDIAAGSAPRPGSPAQQVADLYKSLMDEARIEALGWKPIEPVLQRIDGIASAEAFAREAGQLSASGGGGPFEGALGLDPTDMSRIVVQLSQSGTMLPDREHYLEGTPRYVEVRSKYVDYLTTIFKLTSRADPGGDARAVLALETELARAQVPMAERQSPVASESYTLRRLRREMPGFDWNAWATPQGLSRASSIVLMQPSFFRRFAELAGTTPLATWKAWLAARYITVSAPFISNAFADARFEFFGRTLSGQQEGRTRWRRAVSLVNGYLGDIIGQMYVEKHFPASSKKRVEKLMANVVEAFRQGIREAPWMTEPARREALDKLSLLDVKIGGPTRWRDYRGLVIDPGDLLGNIQRAQLFQAMERTVMLTQDDSRGEWLIAPQTVNAYYNSGRNEIVVPAAMLQPPLFTADADEAVNYGGIGAVIGHEIAHGFDERGRYFDGWGRSRDWWTPDDEREFQKRAAALTEQFNEWSVANGLRPGGSPVLRENLGDLIGLSVAHRAYRLSLGGRPGPELDGLSGDQRFFLGWAQVWRWKIRPEYVDQWVISTPHAHPRFRANGPASNLAAFHEAFGVGPGDAMFRPVEKRIRVW